MVGSIDSIRKSSVMSCSEVLLLSFLVDIDRQIGRYRPTNLQKTKKGQITYGPNKGE